MEIHDTELSIFERRSEIVSSIFLSRIIATDHRVAVGNPGGARRLAVAACHHSINKFIEGHFLWMRHQHDY